MNKEKALEYFMSGYSCSECIIQTAIDEGICPNEFLSCASSFSGGMSSGCACGTVTACQMILGYLFGRNNRFGNRVTAREKAFKFIEEFKKRNGVTCCKILSKGFEAGVEKKKHCSKFVLDALDILNELVRVEING